MAITIYLLVVTSFISLRACCYIKLTAGGLGRGEMGVEGFESSFSFSSSFSAGRGGGGGGGARFGH